jgi:Flp pilus assembly protein TadD
MDDPERRKQLREYMVAVSKGEDPLAALERVTGKSAGELTSAMRAHLNGEIRYQRLVRKSGDYGPMTVTELPASADALLLEAERARMGVAISQRPAYVAEVRSRAKRFPGDRLAGIALARAEIEFGDRKAGMAVVEDLLKADPNDVEALCLGGEARVLDGKEAAKTDAARAKALALEGQGYLGRAFKLNGTRYQTLWMYVEARKLIEPAFPSDNTLDVLLTALDYAPQSPDLRLEAARALVKRKRWTQASNVLGPLIHTPHGDGFVKEAQKLKTEIEQGQTAEAVPAKAG